LINNSFPSLRIVLALFLRQLRCWCSTRLLYPSTFTFTLLLRVDKPPVQL